VKLDGLGAGQDALPRGDHSLTDSALPDSFLPLEKKHARRHSRIDSDRLDIGSRSPDRAALRKLGAASVTPPDVSYVSM
jgi:hypothetical protein